VNGKRAVKIVAAILAALVALELVPQWNGGLCILSVDQSTAEQTVTARFADDMRVSASNASAVRCNVENAQVPAPLSLVHAKWQASCSLTSSTEDAKLRNNSRFYYITRCGFASYAYSFNLGD